jgi:membrane associated rhomboid family serine protease
MGIHDRHYYREQAQPRDTFGVRGLRMISVNTWLIILCVGVFVIDGFLPRRDVWTGRVAGPVYLATTRDAWEIQPRQPGEVIPPNVVKYPRAIVEKSTGTVLGQAEVYNMKFLESYLHFSTRLGFQEIQYWRFIGFQFLHAHAPHLIFNMLGLFFFGPMVEQYLGSKRYLAFYLLCGICGAIMYLILNFGGYLITTQMNKPIAIPGLLFNDTSTPLVGASAGIFGVLMAGAFLAPRAQVLLFFIIPMELRVLAYALVAVAFISVLTGGHNAGGEAGHLGGAIAGFYFIRRPHHLHGFFDFLGRVDPTSHHYRKEKSPRRPGETGPPNRDEIDRILDKINREGLHSLSDKEKRVLREASR